MSPESTGAARTNQVPSAARDPTGEPYQHRQDVEPEAMMTEEAARAPCQGLGQPLPGMIHQRRFSTLTMKVSSSPRRSDPEQEPPMFHTWR